MPIRKPMRRAGSSRARAPAKVRGVRAYGSRSVRMPRQVYARARPSSALSSIGKIARSAASTAARTVANAVFGPVAGNAISSIPSGLRLFGRGAYRTGPNASPTESHMGMGTSVPSFSKSANGVVITHREYIGDISSAVAFTNLSYAINPGLVTTFPWLSQVAQSFTEYDFKQLVFQFKSTSANALNSTNTALGTIVGATQYNAGSADFTSKQEMENYEYAKSCKPSEDQVFPVECAQFQNPVDQLYIRTQPIPASQDARLYDLGNFQLAAVGSQAAAVVGELWVSYSVCLYKPRFVTPGETADFAGCFGASGVSTSAYFGTSRTIDPDSTISVSFPTDSKMQLDNVSEGHYIFSLDMIGDAGTNVVMTRSITNANSNAIFTGGTTSLLTEVNGTTTGHQSLVYSFIVTALNPVLTITAGSIPANLTSYNWFLVRIPTAVLAKNRVAQLPSRVYRMDQPAGRALMSERKRHESMVELSHQLEEDRSDAKVLEEFQTWKSSRQAAALERKELPAPLYVAEPREYRELSEFEYVRVPKSGAATAPVTPLPHKKA